MSELQALLPGSVQHQRSERAVASISGILLCRGSSRIPVEPMRNFVEHWSSAMLLGHCRTVNETHSDARKLANLLWLRTTQILVNCHVEIVC